MLHTGKKKKILVIEDDITLRDNIYDYLELHDFEVISAGDGLDGLKKFKESLPDLVLCDIAMPKLDGFQLFEKIRSESEYSEIPFIFLTAKIGISDFQKGMELGADDYIIKPFNFEQLLSIINNRILKRDERLRFNRQKFQSLIENSLTGVFIHQEGKIIYYNSKFREIFGLKSENEIIEFGDIIDDSDMKELNSKLQDCYNGKIQDFRIELKGKAKKGKDKYVEMFAGFSVFSNKKAVLGNILDISERYAAEQKLRKSEKKFRELLNFTPISIHEVDLEGRIKFVNNEVLRDSGYSLKDVLNKYVWDFTNDEVNRKLTKEFFVNIFNNHPKPKPAVIKVNDKKGEERISEIYWDYVYDDEGRTNGIIVVLADITEMEKSKAALMESEQKFKDLTEIASDWIWEINEQSYFTYTSDKVFDVLGYMPEELIGKRPREVMAKYELTRTLPFLENIFMKRSAFKMHECEFVHKNKSKVILEISGIPFYDEKGNLKGYRGTANDITQKKISQTELLSANTKLSSILDNVKNIVLYETGGENDFYSENIKNLTGYSTKQFITNKVNFEKLIHKSDIEEYRTILNKWKNSEDKNIKLRYRIRTESGEYIYVEDYKTKFFTGNEDYYISGVLIDITERYEYEKEAKILKNAIEESPVGIAIMDTKYNITYANKYFYRISGYSKDEIKNHLDEGLAVSRNDYLRNEFENAIKKYGKYEGRRKAQRKNGDEYHEYFIVNAVKDSNNETQYYILLKQDITEIENLHKQLADANYRIEESNNLKTLLLSNLSVEFRTPINVIFGYSEILKEEVNSIKQQNMLAGIYSSAEKLYSILDSVINLMQIDSLDPKTEKKEMEISREIISAANEFRQTALDKNLYLNINSKSENVKIIGNPAMVRQIFYNIIDNAVRFTNEGGINISIEQYTEEEKNICIVRITDTGTGISKEKEKFLFKNFKQALDSLNSEKGKIGLGLTIAKKMIEFHNGSITVESIPGQCTTVSVVFPAI
jgi:PAS domain S-box-containing protein